MRPRTALLPACIALLALAQAPSASARTYIVELEAKPLASYRGGIEGIPATSPARTGGRLDVTTQSARRYEAFLERKRRAALGRLGASVPVLYRYGVTLAGFAAELSASQAARLEKSPGVAHVSPDRPVKAAATPLDDPGAALGLEPAAFLGLPDGIWEDLGGADGAGTDVIVGVVDSGIHPENPSFADTPVTNGERQYWGSAYGPPPAHYSGVCQTTKDFPATSCNNKLIGAQYFVAGYNPKHLSNREFLSPRGSDNHGSHVASTAAGNFGVEPSVFGANLGTEFISGLAPRARISHYKALWTGRWNGSGPVEAGLGATSDIAAAIETAAADGVDVINASLGGNDAVGGASVTGRAFLGAVEAGVFVAEAAGNAGPDPNTVGDAADAPWVTAIGASSPGRVFATDASVRDRGAPSSAPLEFSGLSFTAALPETPLIDAAAAPASGYSSEDSELCLPGSLRKAAVRGRAVLCKRGVAFFADKSREVLRAGGRGMIIYNQSTERDRDHGDGSARHWVPTAYVKRAMGLTIKQRIAESANPTLELSPSHPLADEADVVTEFSSRGPIENVPALLKPDVVAPGAWILAASSPVNADGFEPGGDIFDVAQGTSMATPHAAGAAALLVHAHPDWSPAEVKSALMGAAAGGVTDRGGEPADPFEVGAGRIDPTGATAVGLVLDETAPNFRAFLEGIDSDAAPASAAAVAAEDLNLPSVALPHLVGTASVERRFTAVGAGSWSASFTGLDGVEAEAQPSSFTVADGATQSVDLGFTASAAPSGDWTFGSLVLNEIGGAGRTLRYPIAIRPETVSTPETFEIAASDAAGTRTLTVGTGYDGSLSGRGIGLAGAQRLATGESVDATTGEASFDPADDGSRAYPFTVTPGTAAVASEISNVDAGATTTDLDLYLFHDDEGDGFGDEDYVVRAYNEFAAERLVLRDPAPGSWAWVVVGFTTARRGSVYDLDSWTVHDASPDDPSNAPGLTVTGDPATATLAGSVDLSVDWAGVADPGKYLGVATLHDSATPTDSNQVGSTLVWLTRPATAGAP